MTVVFFCTGTKPSQVSSRPGYLTLTLLVQCYALAQDTQVSPCLSPSSLISRRHFWEELWMVSCPEEITTISR